MHFILFPQQLILTWKAILHFVVDSGTSLAWCTNAELGCTQGWFFSSVFHPADKNIARLAKVKIMNKPDGNWEELSIPHRNVVQRDLTPLYVDDGLIEVVGFRDAWHGLVLLAPNGHGTRLAQANRIRFEFRKGATDHTFMRIDGEPWKQPLPVDDDAVVVEISHHGQVNMLATHDGRARSVRDPTSVHNSVTDEDIEDDSITGEEWSKFGAASTFRIPDEVDISRLS